MMKKEISIKRLLEYKSRVRETEAKNTLKRLKLKNVEIRFLRLPFYETGHIIKKPISKIDIQKVMKTIIETEPELIIYPGERADPHGTHGMCINAIKTALKQLKMKIECWYYKGGWEEYLIHEADIIIPFNEELMKLKIKAIKEHRSQLDPLFQGLDPRPFWKRAYDRNRENGRTLRRLGLTEKRYAELFKREKTG